MQSIYKSEAGRLAIVKNYKEILEKCPVKYKENNIKTNLGNTFVLECGSENALPLILLHGSGSNSAAWFGDIQQYSNHYHVFCLDIPEEPGLSSEARSELKSSDYELWLEEIVDYFQIAKVNLIGQSLGGWLVLKYAARYAERVNKLVLISPSGIAGQKKSFLFKFIPLMFLGDFGFRKINQLVYHKEELSEEALEYARMLRKHFIYRIEVVPLLTDDELQKIKAKILYIGGEKDVMLDSKKSIER